MQFVNIRFDAFDLEHHDDCDWDHVVVYDGPDVNNNIIGARLCGSQSPPDIQSTTNYMYLVFVSDSAATATGFSATITFIEENGGDYYETFITIIMSSIKMTLYFTNTIVPPY